jgi:tetratricopeptide (TPR) repeat protein
MRCARADRVSPRPVASARLASWAAVLALAAWGTASFAVDVGTPLGTTAQATPAPNASAAPAREPIPPASALTAPLFYQLLIGELQIGAGDPRAAYELVLDAARRMPDEALYRRAMEIALQSRAGDQALAAIRAWRTAFPRSIEAQRNIAQLLIALNRPAEAVEPIRSLIQLTPAPQQPGLIALVPRFFTGSADPKAAAGFVEQAVQPWLQTPATRVAARVAMARAWVAAKDDARALQLVTQAHAMDPKADGPALVALELLPEQTAAEKIVTQHLAAQSGSLAVQLGYGRVLAASQRYMDAIRQLEVVSREQPDLAAPWLTLGALHVELRHPKEATAAVKRYLDIVDTPAAPPSAPQADPAAGNAVQVLRARVDEDNAAESRAEGRTTAYLLLAQAAELESRFADAEVWLQKIENPTSALEVQVRRASILARQGNVDQARELVRKTPERNAQDRRAKLLAEAQVLRDVKQWSTASQVLQTAAKEFPDDPDLLYEQSMMAEKLDRIDEMERLLRRVIELKPDHHHAYNALGYSLADRNLRLDEARTLIRKALELAPGEPFITDSLGWVEFRLGNRDEALRLLRQAYSARPDAEIGAHLGEVLWALGQRDEAMKVWRESRQRDAANEVLRETLLRLKVDL